MKKLKSTVAFVSRQLQPYVATGLPTNSKSDSLAQGEGAIKFNREYILNARNVSVLAPAWSIYSTICTCS